MKKTPTTIQKSTLALCAASLLLGLPACAHKDQTDRNQVNSSTYMDSSKSSYAPADQRRTQVDATTQTQSYR